MKLEVLKLELRRLSKVSIFMLCLSIYLSSQNIDKDSVITI